MSEKPEKPSEQDCCGSGCSPCIFDVYEQKLKTWQSQGVGSDINILSDLKNSPFRLIDIREIAPSTYLYTFQAINSNGEDLSGRLSMHMGDYLILRGGNKISRPYTPVLNNCLDNASFQTIIKLYNNGQMSEILRKAVINDVYLWRGPYNHYTFKKTKFLLLLGAGTGIVPLFNIAKELVQDEDIETFIKMFVCVSNIQSILLRNELKELNNFWNFKSILFFSDLNVVGLGIKEKAVFRKLAVSDINEELLSYGNGSVGVVICGPDGFNAFCKSTVTAFGVNDEDVTVM